MPKTTTKKVRRQLEDRRAMLQRRTATMERHLAELAADTGGDTDFSEEGGDADTSVVERDRLRSQIAEADELIHGIDAALAAVEDGTYGTCRVCGGQIPEERLDALPGTSLCVACKAGGH